MTPTGRLPFKIHSCLVLARALSLASSLARTSSRVVPNVTADVFVERRAAQTIAWRRVFDRAEDVGARALARVAPALDPTASIGGERSASANERVRSRARLRGERGEGRARREPRCVVVHVDKR